MLSVSRGVTAVLLAVCAIAVWSCGSVTTSAPQPTGGGTTTLASTTQEQTTTTTESATQGAGASTDVEWKYATNNWYEFSDLSTKASWSSGTISFKLRGMSYDSLPSQGDAFMLMAKLTTSNGSEGNFQFNIADRVPRLISQRFDGACSTFCEHQDSGSVNWDASETYSFSVSWSATSVTCVVKDSAGSSVFSGSVATDGAYSGYDWVRVGNGVLPPYGGSSNEITIINPKIE